MNDRKEKMRLNLLLTAQVRAELDELQRKSKSSTLTEVVRRSLALYHFFTDMTADGWALVLRHPERGEQQVKVL